MAKLFLLKHHHSKQQKLEEGMLKFMHVLSLFHLYFQIYSRFVVKIIKFGNYQSNIILFFLHK